MSDDKQWTKAEIKENLREHDKWVERAIVAIYNKQTADEKATKRTSRLNGVGFNSVDAEFLTSLAEGIQEYGGLTDNQMEHGRDAIMKYAGQLADIANGEI